MRDLFEVQPTLKSPVPKPAPIDPGVWRALDAAARLLARGEPVTEAIIDPAMRSRIEFRREALREGMRSGIPSEIAAALLTQRDMRGGFRPESASEGLWFAKLRAADLDGVPLWALWDAVSAFRKGEIGAAIARPTAGQLRIRALALAKTLFDEERLIEKVLAAPIEQKPGPADVARKRELAHRWKKFAESLTDGRAQAKRSNAKPLR
jgi:hypothetical protein